MYEFDSRIRYSEVDSNQNLTVLGLIDYFQDCSTFQSEDLGIGVDYLNEHQLGWVVVSYHVTIERLPRLGEHICIQTFPYNLKGMFGSRNYAMLDDSGSQVACADSLWVLVDLTTGKPTRKLSAAAMSLVPRLPWKRPTARSFCRKAPSVRSRFRYSAIF